MKLASVLCEKPWGQLNVPHLPADNPTQARIGEVSFVSEAGADLPVLIKYLYTSERLSIQVHPNNQQARSRGHASGKDEMWIVLDAQPGATIGLGLVRDACAKELAAAVADGSIEQLVDWRPVRRGDVIYNSAGTIHAAGAGLVLLEVQQAIDLTYRLYDYGRPRELHLAEGLSVAVGKPHFDRRDCNVADGQSRILVDGPYFGAAWCAGQLPAGLPHSVDHWQVVVVDGEVAIGSTTLAAGECALVPSLAGLDLPSEAIVLLAWPTPEAMAKAA